METLPDDRATLEAIAAELAVAERATAARLAGVRALEGVVRQSRDPRFQGPAARAHLEGAFARLRAIVTGPRPALVLSDPLLSLPSKKLPPGDYLAGELAAIVHLARDVAAVLATATAPDPALARTLEVLAGSRRSVELVRYLADRDGRQAHLDRIAVEIYGARPCNATLGRPNARRQAQRTAQLLMVGTAPLRLSIDDSTVYLIDHTDQQI